jgi:hypothetical protein
MIALSDVVVHTWDLARGAGLDETLEPSEVQRLLAGMSQLPDEMRGDFFGPRVDRTACSASAAATPRSISTFCGFWTPVVQNPHEFRQSLRPRI